MAIPVAIAQVHGLMKAASDATPQMVTSEQLVETGWPLQIEPIALQAVELMWERGQFSEEHEEEVPSLQRGHSNAAGSGD